MRPNIVRSEHYLKHLRWDGDNRWFILGFIVPNLRLSEEDKRVMRWAYEGGWEMQSDGETGVKDAFLDGVIKDPAGVVHDYINRVKDHRTPDGHTWTARQSNALYRRIKKALGMGFRHRWRRWLGLTLSSWKWWK